MFRLPGTNDPLLGRPLALYDTYRDAAGRPQGVDIVYQAIGRMTRRLATMKAGDRLETWGPLGNGFPPTETGHLIMVAGGIGARSLLLRRSIRPAVALVAIIPPLILGWGTGRFPPSVDARASVYERPNSVADLRHATAMIPADAPVNADAGLCVWLANRHTINDFPDKLDNGAYVVIDEDTYIGANTDAALRQKALDALPSSRRLLYDDGRFQVWSPVGD